MTQASHGPDWYSNERYAGPRTFDHPPDWNAFTGHYRSHNPWNSNFRVILRNGKLWFSWGWGGWEWELEPLPDGEFRVEAVAWSPRRIRFDTVLDGVATRATYDCAPYYRTFTP